MQENTESTDSLRNSESVIVQVPKFATANKELGTFTNVVQAISTLVDEATFELTSEGLTFRGMDPSHVGLIDVTLPPNCFYEFAVGNATKFGVRIDELAKVLKKFDEKAGKVQFTIEESKLVIKQEEQRVALRLIESTGGSTPLPKLNFNAQFDLSKDGIKKFLKFLEFGEYTTLKASEHILTLETKDDYGEYEHKYDNTQYLENILVREESKATYSNDYISKVVKVLQAKNDTIKVEYSTKMPLRMEVRPFKVGTMHFYLAPRVQD